MTSLSDVCGAIYGLVHLFGEGLTLFDENTLVFEEARKLHRLLRGIEVFVSEIEPFLKGVRAWSSLRDIEGTLTEVVQVLAKQSEKGALVQYLQADRTLSRFAAAAARLDASLAKLQAEAFGGPCPGCESGACCGGPPGQAGTDDLSVAVPGAPGAGGVQLRDEARRELCGVRALLRGARFELPPAHLANLQRFRHACDHLQVHFSSMMDSYGGMMGDLSQAPLLSKEAFAALIHELQQEVEAQQAAQQTSRRPASGAASTRTSAEHTEQQWPKGQHHHHRPEDPHLQPQRQQHHHHHQNGAAEFGKDSQQAPEAEEQRLRMLMDVVRAYHINTDCEAPLEYICPLTHQLMQDPVLLHDTGHSYERKALEEWWTKGHHFCPRTGMQLRRLNFSPNHNLRSAIERWHLHSDMHLSFRPALNTLVAQHLAGKQEDRESGPGPRSQVQLEAERKRVLVQVPESAADQLVCCIGGPSLVPINAAQQQTPEPACASGNGRGDDSSYGGSEMDSRAQKDLLGLKTAAVLVRARVETGDEERDGGMPPDNPQHPGAGTAAGREGLQPQPLWNADGPGGQGAATAAGGSSLPVASTDPNPESSGEFGCSLASVEDYGRASSPALSTPARSASKELSSSMHSSPLLLEGCVGGAGSLAAEAMGLGSSLKGQQQGLLEGLAACCAGCGVDGCEAGKPCSRRWGQVAPDHGCRC